MRKIDSFDTFTTEMMSRDKESLISELVELRVENQQLKWKLEQQKKKEIVWEK